MSQQSLKEFLALLAALVGRKGSSSDPDDHLTERIPPAGTEFAVHCTSGERDAWLIAHEAGSWSVYPPNSPHRPTASDGEVYVLHFLPEDAIVFTGT